MTGVLTLTLTSCGLFAWYSLRGTVWPRNASKTASEKPDLTLNKNASELEDSDDDFDDDDDLPLARIGEIKSKLSEQGITMDDFVHVDDDVVATESWSDDDIVADILSQDEDSDSDTEPLEPALPSASDAIMALETVRRLLETYEDVPIKMFQNLSAIESFVNVKQKQSKISDFFKQV